MVDVYLRLGGWGFGSYADFVDWVSVLVSHKSQPQKPLQRS